MTGVQTCALPIFLFEPVISLGDCVNRHGEPYTIDNKSASLWYKQEADIPGNLKKAANDGRVYKGIGKYFTDEVLDKVLSGVKADDMVAELLNLIKESDLSEMEKGDLNKLYEDGDLGGFLGRAFLYAILPNNMKKDASYEDYSKTAQVTAADINHEIEAFRQFVGQFKKPAPLSPPLTIATEEMK